MQVIGQKLLIQEVAEMTRLFEEAEGRRPRIMIETIESSIQHYAASQMASGFADLGFDVDIAPVFHSAAKIAKHAVENDVHFIGIISGTVIKISFIESIIDELKLMQREVIIIIYHGDSLTSDKSADLKQLPVHFFQPSTSLAEVAKVVLKKLHQK